MVYFDTREKIVKMYEELKFDMADAFKKQMMKASTYGIEGEEGISPEDEGFDQMDMNVVVLAMFDIANKLKEIFYTGGMSVEEANEKVKTVTDKYLNIRYN